MNEAKSIESAVTRAQQTGHVQPPAPDLEERRRRFELQRARERAEKERQGQVPKDAGAGVQGEGDHDRGTKKETGEGGIDVRV